MKLGFRLDFKRPNANRMVFSRREARQPHEISPKGLKSSWLPQAMLTFGDSGRTGRSGGPLSGGLAVMTDCGVGHGGNGRAQGASTTPPARSLAPAGGGWNDDRKVIGTVTNR